MHNGDEVRVSTWYSAIECEREREHQKIDRSDERKIAHSPKSRKRIQVAISACVFSHTKKKI